MAVVGHTLAQVLFQRPFHYEGSVIKLYANSAHDGLIKYFDMLNTVSHPTWRPACAMCPSAVPYDHIVITSQRFRKQAEAAPGA